MDFIIGGGAVVGAYLLYIAATKGAPAAYAVVKGWWTAGKADLAALKSDVENLKATVANIKTKVGM